MSNKYPHSTHTQTLPTYSKKFLQSTHLKPTVPSIAIKELKTKVTLEISGEVEDKIKYLCHKIPNNEWSGILFYEIVGDFKTGKYRCVAKDILPLDMGSTGFTSYEFDTRYTDYIMEDVSRAKLSIGHVHSHNNMGTFFSGTDTNELKENSDKHNVYLSLIVNNRMDTSAKLCYRGEIKTITTSKTPDGEDISITSVEKLLLVHDCNVIFNRSIKVDSKFDSSVTSIINEYDKALKERVVKAKNFNAINSPIKSYHKHVEVEPEDDEDDWYLAWMNRDKSKDINVMSEDDEDEIKELLLLGEETNQTLTATVRKVFLTNRANQDKYFMDVFKYMKRVFPLELEYYSVIETLAESSLSSNTEEEKNFIIDLINYLYEDE